MQKNIKKIFSKFYEIYGLFLCNFNKNYKIPHNYCPTG